MFQPQYELNANINWQMLSANPNAVHILEQHMSKIDWDFLSDNPNAIHLLEQNNAKINWNILFKNSNAVHLIEQHIKQAKPSKLRLKLSYLSANKNPNAIRILEKNMEKIDWSLLSANPSAIEMLEITKKFDWRELSKNPKAIHLLEKYPKRIHWRGLLTNPKAIHLIEKDIHNIQSKVLANYSVSENEFGLHEAQSWYCLSINPGAAKLLEKHPDKINWRGLSKNPNAVYILEKNINKIDWYELSANPGAVHMLASLNSTKMKEQNKNFKRELVEYVLNPLRIQHLADLFNLDMEEYLDLLYHL